MEPILNCLPRDWEPLVWNNGGGYLRRMFWNGDWWQKDMSAGDAEVPNLGPHARFAAIDWASHDTIFVMDDDVLVASPQIIVDTFLAEFCSDFGPDAWDGAVCNLPMEFRPHYPDSSPLGFGSVFHRDAPEKAFSRFFSYHHNMSRTDPLFLRESCRIFTVLTPRILVDVAKTDMPYASDPNRLWMQPDHVKSRDTALDLAREVRDHG